MSTTDSDPKTEQNNTWCLDQCNYIVGYIHMCYMILSYVLLHVDIN